MNTFIAHTLEEFNAGAQAFAQSLKGGEVIALQGDLGAGKTTFVQAIAAELSSKHRAKSPTFAVMNEYAVDAGDIRRVLHLDLYRFKSEQELEGLAIEDYLQPDTVVFVEWPERISKDALPYTYHIRIDAMDDGSREVSIE